MTTPEQTTVVLNPSLPEFIQELIALTSDGWEIDEENPPRVVMWQYEAHLWRNPTEAQRNAQPPLTKAESLAKARAVKAEKAAQRAAAEAQGTDPASQDESPY